MDYKISQLNIHDPHHSQRTGEILVQEATEENNSHLLALIEIDSNQPEDIEFIHSFLELTFNAYENSSLLEPEPALEHILQNLNENLPQLFPNNKNFSYNFHAFIGLLKNEQIYFSSYGRIKAWLIKPGLIKDIIDRTAPADNKKIFDFTVSGKIQANDRLIITTPSLNDYISLEKIKKTVSALPPQSSVAHLSNILESVPSTVSFFSIILQFLGSAAESAGDIKIAGKLNSSAGSKNSLDQLFKTQKETEKILTQPSLMESLREKIKEKKKEALTRQTAADKSRLPAGQVKKTKTNFKLKLPLNIIKKSIGSLGNIWEYLTQNRARHRLLKTLTGRLTLLFKRFNQISKINKILIVLTVVLVLVFSQSLIWQEKKMQSLKNKEEYQNLLTQVADKKNAIEASLIYNDTVRAKQLLKEIQAIITVLPQTTKEQLNEREQLAAEIQTIFEKVWKVINVAEPLSLINFREINLTAEVNRLGFKDDYLYAFNDSDQVFAVRPKDGNTLILDKFNLKVRQAAYFDKLNALTVLTDDNQFYTVNQNEIKNLPATLPAGLRQADDLVFYLDKAYLLDKASKQIYRLTYFGNDFRNGQAWIREDLPIDQTVSITIDGYIYALQADGQILRLGSGKKQDFPQIIIEPALSANSRIFTTDQSEFLYIMDPANQRLVILNKNGDLINQYRSDQFNNLKDFIVRENEKKVYLLNGSQIFVIAIK
jgi:cell division protein FtsL